mmetsp:Transcript_333/g.710  ORF Transcript_333/g.710 Transcript_333/m.710 type:complete len:402 (+) Transcript_333:170-1375(+)
MSEPILEADNPWTGGYQGQQFKSDVMDHFLQDALHVAKHTVLTEVTTKMGSRRHGGGGQSDPGARPPLQRRLPPVREDPRGGSHRPGPGGARRERDPSGQGGHARSAHREASYSQGVPGTNRSGGQRGALMYMHDDPQLAAEPEYSYQKPLHVNSPEKRKPVPLPHLQPSGSGRPQGTKPHDSRSAGRPPQDPNRRQQDAAERVARRALEQPVGLSNSLSMFAEGGYDDARSVASSRSGTNAYFWKQKGPGSVARSAYPSTAVTSRVDSQVLAETMERLERLEAHLNEEKQRRKHTEEQLNKLKHHVEIKKRPSDGDGGVAVLASGARDRDGDLRSFPGYINEKQGHGGQGNRQFSNPERSRERDPGRERKQKSVQQHASRGVTLEELNQGFPTSFLRGQR